MIQETDHERAIRAEIDVGDFTKAATKALEVYGQELLGFLITRLRSAHDGEEAYALFTEDFWKGLPKFAFHCTARGWMYTLACHAANRYTTSPERKRARQQARASEAPLSDLVQSARSETEAHRRTDVKNRVRALRELLTDDDQLLLLLYVDRRLPWREIALMVHPEIDARDNEELTRLAARLRKRFERVKTELKTLAEREGLLEARRSSYQ